MRAPFLAMCAASALAAIPALAQGQPDRFRLETTITPGETARLGVGTVPGGEFRFGLRASGDGEKRLLLTQQRDGGPRFTVLRLPSAASDDACQGAAGTIVCTGITTPATPAGRTWTFALRNRSNRPISIALTITFRRIAGR